MNNDNEKVEKLKARIDSLENTQKKITKKQKQSGAGFGFKISTEIVGISCRCRFRPTCG